AGGRPDRLADRHSAVLPREDRNDRDGRLGAPRAADVRGGPGRPREPTVEGTRPPERMARSVHRDPGGWGAEGWTRSRDNGVQSILRDRRGTGAVRHAAARRI